MSFRCGYVALLGKPNAGKSTLLNRLLGVKLAAVSGLPQTTRESFLGIHSDDARQIIFMDLPGMTAGNDRLNEVLRHQVLRAMGDVDVVVYLVDVEDTAPLDDNIAAALALIHRPILCVVTKLDGADAGRDPIAVVTGRFPAEVCQRFAAVMGVSARADTGLEQLLAAVTPLLPEGEPLYDTEELTDRDLRFLAQEMIREKAFSFLHEELPYAIAVVVDEFKEREGGKWYIAATIHVERESQKGMVIGKGGAMLKRISQSARRDIEEICQAPVYLELWVKVRENWRKNDNDLRAFGYQPSKKSKPGKRRRP